MMPHSVEDTSNDNKKNTVACNKSKQIKNYTLKNYILAFTKTDLTEMVGTVIHILSAVVTGKPKKTLTFIVSGVVDT